MKYQFRPQGVCSQMMTVDVEDGIVRELQVMGGCDGNLQGIAQLVRGRKAEDVIELLGGIRCGFKETSCPDQLARGLAAILAESK
ncbi:MAG: TIGR03905 family TSCPD domain-containing protein [Oscillospiraceae bacterium]|nr:TIGR03905 family TSCPD domain-containing protein [Oscillospiraceae bacterium]